MGGPVVASPTAVLAYAVVDFERAALDDDPDAEAVTDTDAPEVGTGVGLFDCGIESASSSGVSTKAGGLAFLGSVPVGGQATRVASGASMRDLSSWASPRAVAAAPGTLMLRAF